MQVNMTPKFESDIKFYVKKKKYTKIYDDVNAVVDELEQGNILGDKLENIKLPEGTAAYKVRIANTSANVGKSNGFRLIYYLIVEEKIYLLTIYSKKDDERILNDNQISMIIKNIMEEI